MPTPARDTDPTQDTTTPELVSEATAARILGVSPRTLQDARLGRLWRNPLRDLPHVAIGRAIRYRRGDIIAWIERHIVRHDIRA